jgi:hypothetical protein
MGKNYTDRLLTNVAKGYKPLNHVNEIIMPPLMVTKDTGDIAVYGADNMRIVSTVKAPEGETPTVSFNVTTADAYVIKKHALKVLANDSEIENQEVPFDAFRDKTEFVYDLLSCAREYGLASYMNTVGNFTYNTTLATTYQWGGSTDDPLGNINTAIDSVKSKAGKPRSMISLILPDNVFQKLVFLPEILSTLGFASRPSDMNPAYIRPEALAIALGIAKVIVPEGIYNSAADGQTDSLANMWGKHAWAAYIPSTPKIKEHCFGYTVKKRDAIIVDRWRDEDRMGFWIRGTDAYDQYVMNEKCVYMIENAIA